MARLRRVAVLPSLLTLGNGACGFVALIMASRVPMRDLADPSLPAYAAALDLLAVAGWLIFGGMVFDVLDGRVARMNNATSRFGAELDSLCDVVSFGVAPAFLLLKLGPTAGSGPLYRLLFVAAVGYLLATILRLARFNVETTADAESHRHFKGLPSPAAAGCLAAFAVLRGHLSDVETLFGVDLDLLLRRAALGLPAAGLVLGGLMVSNLVYPHLVNQSLRGKRSFAHLVGLMVLAVLLVVLPGLSLVLAFWGYALAGPVRAAWGRVFAAPTLTPVADLRAFPADGTGDDSQRVHRPDRGHG